MANAARKSRDYKALAEREEARLRLDGARNMRRFLKGQKKIMALGDYTVARRTRLSNGWAPQISSADAHLDDNTLDKMRALSQRAMRNNPLARAIACRMVDLVVGPGMTLQAKTADPKWNKEAEKLFREWGMHHADLRGLMDLHQIERAIVSAVLVDGDIGVIKVEGRRDKDNKDGLDLMHLQCIEAARIVSPSRTASDQPAGTIVSGVELDADGRPIKFHVGQYNKKGTGRGQGTEAFDAETFLFLVNPKRFSQTRGEPALCATLSVLDQISTYVASTAVAANIAACQGLIIKSNFPAAAQAAALGGGLTRDNGYLPGGITKEQVTEMEPGMVRYIAPNEEVVQIKPEHPTTEFEQFIRMLCRIAGADQSMPLEFLLLDFSQANFYSSRAAIGMAYRTIEVWQHWLVRRFLTPVYRDFIAFAMRDGLLPMRDDWDAHRWQPPERPSFDPLKEAAADKMEVENNLSTLSVVHGRRGLDTDDVFAERSIEVKKQKALNITPPTTPGANANGSGMVKDPAEAGTT